VQDSFSPPLTLAPSGSGSQAYNGGASAHTGAMSPSSGMQPQPQRTVSSSARRDPAAVNMSFHVNPRFDDDSDYFSEGPHSPYVPRDGAEAEYGARGHTGAYVPGRSGQVAMMDAGGYRGAEASSPVSGTRFDGSAPAARSMRPSGSFRRQGTFGRDGISSHLSSPGGSMVRSAPRCLRNSHNATHCASRRHKNLKQIHVHDCAAYRGWNAC
jgi:hypothetical protein